MSKTVKIDCRFCGTKESITLTSTEDQDEINFDISPCSRCQKLSTISEIYSI